MGMMSKNSIFSPTGGLNRYMPVNTLISKNPVGRQIMDPLNLFQDTPALKGPTAMPLPDDEQVKQAQRQSIAQQMQRSSRGSTVLTSGGDSLG